MTEHRRQNVSPGENRYGRLDGTVWPIVGEGQWRLVHGSPSRSDVLHTSSIVGAYAHLTDPAIAQAAAIEALKRARKIVKEADRV